MSLRRREDRPGGNSAGAPRVRSGMMRWIAAAVLAAGCYRSSPPPASPEPAPARPAFDEPQASYAHARFRSTRPAPEERGVIAEVMAKLEQFTDDMCACKDRACTDALTQELTRWSAEMGRAHPDLKPSETEMEEVMRVSERLSKCMMAAMGHGSPPSPTP